VPKASLRSDVTGGGLVPLPMQAFSGASLRDGSLCRVGYWSSFCLSCAMVSGSEGPPGLRRRISRYFFHRSTAGRLTTPSKIYFHRVMEQPQVTARFWCTRHFAAASPRVHSLTASHQARSLFLYIHPHPAPCPSRPCLSPPVLLSLP
jgi:hypothetical protein